MSTYLFRTVSLAAAIILSTAHAAAQQTVIMGDMNGDSEITAADVAILASTALGTTPQRTLVVSGETLPDTPSTAHEWVDLGLPSGTLWATVNLGAMAPEDFGTYVAWGETAPSDAYNWGTYSLCNGSQDDINKYCTEADYGTVDGFTTLVSADDAATAMWGSAWCIPTKEQFEEVIDKRYTKTSVTTHNGVKGIFIKALEGEAQIFLPAAGHKSGSLLVNDNPLATYWTSSLVDDKPYRAWCAELPAYTGSTLKTGGADRATGHPIRAVLKQRP